MRDASRIPCSAEQRRKTPKYVCFIIESYLYHRAKLVQEAASAMDIHLLQLPGYSPDFMPVEHLWQWLRENLTYHICYDSQQELIDAVSVFQSQINANPIAVTRSLVGQKTRANLTKKNYGFQSRCGLEDTLIIKLDREIIQVTRIVSKGFFATFT